MNFIQNIEKLYLEFNKQNKISVPNSENYLSQFIKTGLPTKQDEEYKYTNLNSLQSIKYQLPSTKTVDFAQISELLVSESYQRVVFVDGIIDESLSKLDNLNLPQLSLTYQLENPSEIFSKHFGTISNDELSLVQLAKAFTRNGFTLLLEKNQVIETPIQLLYITSESNENTFNPIRNFVYAAENSKVEIIETHYNLSKNVALNLGLSEIISSSNANVLWHKIQNDSVQNFMLDQSFVEQKTNSLATVNTFSFGNQLTRNNLDFIQNGSNIQSYMNGISLIKGSQLVDHHTAVHHNQPHCESFQTYKGIYDGESRGVFNGKVFVNKIAQKTNAYQQNNNVLLSKGASIETKPQLEIFADDVKCSHGCTVGQLNEEALFYLRSRGISKKSAQAMLLFAFANDALVNIESPNIMKYLRHILSKQLHVEI